jgi:hypothetical protein
MIDAGLSQGFLFVSVKIMDELSVYIYDLNYAGSTFTHTQAFAKVFNIYLVVDQVHQAPVFIRISGYTMMLSILKHVYTNGALTLVHKFMLV